MNLRDELRAQVGPKNYISDLCGRAADEITRLRAEIAAAETRVKASDEHLVSALEAIIKGYPRSDISHEDFRVKVTHWAEDALTEYRKTEVKA